LAYNNGFFDGLDQALLKRLNKKGARVGSRNVAHLLKLHLASVVLHKNAFEHRRVGAAGANFQQGLVEVRHCFVHVVGQRLDQKTEFFFHDAEIQ